MGPKKQILVFLPVPDNCIQLVVTEMSESNQDKLRLAEAMGWKFREGKIDDRYWCLSSPGAGYPDKYHSKWKKPPGQDWQCELCGGGDDTPDPFTDANDDYAVLKWARENLTPRQFVKFSENIANLLIGLEKKKPFDALCISLTTEYQIGFYARAALKVLERV